MTTHIKRIDPDQPGNYTEYTKKQPISGPDANGDIVQHHGDSALLALDGWLPVVSKSYDADLYKLVPGRYTDDGAEGWLDPVELTDPEKAVRLELHRENKKVEINTAFEAEEIAPVEVLGIQWHGGYQSAGKLYNARQFLTELGATECTFTDTSNVAHTLTIAQATEVIHTIAYKYQVDFLKKEAKLVAIDNATTKEQIEAITWES